MTEQTSDLRVLVTAGAAGIGRAVARAFDRAGARVFVCDLDAQAVAGLPDHWGWKACDVSDEAAVGRLCPAVEAQLGGRDVLVNCAPGSTGRRGLWRA